MRLLLLLSLLWLGPLQAQLVKIAEAGPYPQLLCEPSLSISRQDPAKMVVGTVLNRVFVSQDSGRSWRGDTLRSPFGVYGDPVLLSDTAGAFYYFHLSDPTGLNWRSEELLDRIVCQKSVDQGQTWSEGSYAGYNPPKDQDKPWAVVDQKNNALYLTWTQFDRYNSERAADQSHIMFSRSLDAGLSWSPARQISYFGGDCRDGDSTAEGAVPAAGLEGELYVAWSRAEEIFFQFSPDGGQTWQERERPVARQVGGWKIEIPGLQRANGMPVSLCDQSNGKHAGRVYISWVDRRLAHYAAWLIFSDDRGQTWSEPRRVGGAQTQADQFFCALQVDPTNGALYAVYYDRRDLSDWETAVYAAASFDGGISWREKKLSEQAFRPRPDIFFGDYNHIDAFRGVIRPIWTEWHQDRLSVWTALLRAEDFE